VALPIVFVHGFAGSAQQYESQALRFAANGYPQERIVAYDHDGAGFDIDGYAAGVDEVVEAARTRFGVEQVYLVGHSRGTFVANAYLADPTRAAKVARYVAIDGAPCSVAVPCRAVVQADLPGQAHVEVATSAESFALQYEFLVGNAPEVVDIEPQREPVVLSGRAVNFPANTGRAGATLDVWSIDPATGARLGDEPYATSTLDADGAFGPLEVATGGHYEYVLSSADSPIEHHLYLTPHVRSSDLVRLLSSEANGTTRTNTNVGADHAALVVMRMREWYAADDPDVAGDQSDVLEVSTHDADGDGDAVDVITDFVGNAGIGLHLHDDAASPGVSTLAALPYFSEQPFQSGVDVYLPASDPPSGTVTVTSFPRGDRSHPQTFHVPAWPSDRHSVSLVFSDHRLD
jgi:pimeloyl-ACP methyl ester carboxylesterase